MATRPDDLSSPAQTIRNARLARGLTLRQLAGQTGLPYSTLSKLENGKMALTYDKLARLARGLDCDIGSLLASPAAEPQQQPAGTGRRSLSRAGDWPNARSERYNHHYPGADLLGKLMVPIIIEVVPTDLAAHVGLVRHEGEEYLYVLSGAMDLHSDLYAPLRLEAGDSLYFDSGMAHAYIRASAEPCRILTVCAGAGIRRLGESAGMIAVARGGGDSEGGGASDGESD